MIVSLTAQNTSLMFSVSARSVKAWSSSSRSGNLLRFYYNKQKVFCFFNFKLQSLLTTNTILYTTNASGSVYIYRYYTAVHI